MLVEVQETMSDNVIGFRPKNNRVRVEKSTRSNFDDGRQVLVCSHLTSLWLKATIFRFFFDQSTHLEPSTSVLVRLAELVLIFNNYIFDGKHY